MKINRKQRIQYLFQNSFFILVFVALIFLLGVVANQYVFVKDMTQASRSVLTKGSIEILKKMEKIRKTNFSMSFEFYNVLDRKNKKLFFLFLFDVI